MVLVLMGGEITQRFITLSEPVAQDSLSLTANRLTQLLANHTADQLKSETLSLNALETEVFGFIREQMNQADSLVSGEVVLDGITNVLAEPEFSGSEEARQALRVLEEKPMLQSLLSQTILTGPSKGGVHVLIGGEGVWDSLRQCSIVLARYGTPGLATGTLGVLGPMRMSYGHTISIVRFLSGLLSDLVDDTMIE
jgi:heat-inducible transcriptional repressor